MNESDGKLFTMEGTSAEMRGFKFLESLSQSDCSIAGCGTQSMTTQHGMDRIATTEIGTRSSIVSHMGCYDVSDAGISVPNSKVTRLVSSIVMISPISAMYATGQGYLEYSCTSHVKWRARGEPGFVVILTFLLWERGNNVPIVVGYSRRLVPNL